MSQLDDAETPEGEEDVLSLNIPPAPEVNPIVYNDLEPLLFKGFVYQAASVGGIPFVFKSLNQHELECLALTARVGEDAHKHYSRFLAYGVWRVNDANMLADRDNSLKELTVFFEELPLTLRNIVIRHLSELNRRASRAVFLTEAYQMESSSRFRWYQMKGFNLADPTITGIEGTTTLGLNWGQLTWRALNLYEDDKQRQEQDWENAKFVASSFAGKGMQKVHSADRRRRQEEEAAKRSRKEQILRSALLGEETVKRDYGGAQLIVARTVEELADQMERDLKGEKDWHDMVIAEYEDQERRKREDRKAYLEEMGRLHEEDMAGRSVSATTSFQGLSRVEVEQRLVDRQSKAIERLAQQSYTDPLDDERKEAMLSKWIDARVPTTGRTTDNVIGVPTRAGATPWRTK